MRRVATLLVTVAVIGAAFLAVRSLTGGPGEPTYWLEVDNAFGLVDGSDVKIAGVRAGKVTEINLDERDMRAVVGLDLTQAGYDVLRRDVSCQTRPQSLIGEYFVDCNPGHAKQSLPKGSRIPVTRTSTTVPMDLVNDIMRRPYRERFTIVFNELGGALAARGDDLNETIRRASPALREVDRVLATLRRQRHTIGQLTVNADRVLADLADNRSDLNRFVRETGETTQIAATRTEPLASGIRQFPRFLAELRPTLDVLGDAAARQEGALRTLNANRRPLRGFLERLGPFSEKSRPAIKTLGEAAGPGRAAVKAALPRVAELGTAVKPLPELANNLAIVLEHLGNRAFAVEPDNRTADGKGLSGLEALMRYIYASAQATNFVDGNNYILKTSVFADSACGAYADAQKVKTDRANDRCRAWLGPNQPGVTTPDPTTGASAASVRGTRTPPREPTSGLPPALDPAAPPGPAAPAAPAAPPQPNAARPGLLPGLGELLDGLLPTGDAKQQGVPLLDYLLGP